MALRLLTVTLLTFMALMTLPVPRVESSEVSNNTGLDNEGHQNELLPFIGPLTKEEAKSPSNSRKRRATFSWPTGSLFVAEFYFTIPIEAPTGVTIPLLIDVPYRFSLPDLTTGTAGRSKGKGGQEGLISNRVDFYGIVEGVFERFGLDGKTCMLRAICERAESDVFEAGMLGEMISIILAAASSDDSDELREYQLAEQYGQSYGDCWSIYPDCPVSIFEWME